MKKSFIFIMALFILIPKTFAGFWEDLDNKARSLLFPSEYNYNSGIESYESGEYSDAISHFLDINCEGQKTQLCFKTYHNLGNSLYYYSTENPPEERVENLEDAVNYYSKALEIENDEETEKNKEYVQEKLDLLKEQIKNQEGQQKQNSDNNSGNNNSQSQNFGNQDNSESPVEDVPDYVDKGKIGESLTPDEEQSMDSRLNYLKKDSLLNADSFDKQKNNNMQTQMFGDFELQFGIGIQEDNEKDR